MSAPAIVTFYRWPGDRAAYEAMLSQLATGDVLVLNPQSGDVHTAEGLGERDRWVDIREMARDAGVAAVLYQPVLWGGVDASTVGARVARARQWCDWDGIFFDEAPAYWQWWWRIPGSWLLRLHGLARSLRPGNRGWSIWNAGTGIDRRLARLPGSIWVTYEGPANGLVSPQSDIDPRRQAALCYSSPSWHGMRGDGTYGYAYFTVDQGAAGNPWDGDTGT